MLQTIIQKSERNRRFLTWKGKAKKNILLQIFNNKLHNTLGELRS